MPGLTSGLNIGLSGLHANQTALNAIGNNIANVKTPGYSRQEVVLSPTHAENYGNLQMGSGVDVTGIHGIRDKFLDMQVTQSISSQSGSKTRYEGVHSVASAFEDDGTTGLNSQIHSFFSGIQRLAAAPEDGSLRTNVVGAAQSMVTAFKSRYKMLVGQAGTANDQVGTLVAQVNTLSKQIAALNHQIGNETTSGSDNASRDQRQALADQLGALVGVQAFEDNRGQMQITLDSGAAVLVSGDIAFNMSATADSAHYGGNYRVDVNSSDSGHPTDVTHSIKGGELGGNLDLRDNILPSYEAQLDAIAASISGQVNLVNRAGYAADGKTTGIDLFQGGSLSSPQPNDASGLPASLGITPGGPADYKGMVNDWQVNAAVAASPDLIAAAGAPNSPGDNTNATAMANLENAHSQFSTQVTSMINTVGTHSQGYETDATNQENLTTALKGQRSSRSAVDLDAEAANLLTFQRGYEASSRFINVINTLMDQLVNNLGTTS